MVIHKMDPNYFLPDTIASRYMHGPVTSLFIGVMGTVVEKYMAQSLHVGLSGPFSNPPVGMCAIYFDLEVSPNDCLFSSLNYWFELCRFPHPLSHWILDRLQKRVPSKKCWPIWMWHDVVHLSTCSVAKLHQKNNNKHCRAWRIIPFSKWLGPLPFIGHEKAIWKENNSIWGLTN